MVDYLKRAEAYVEVRGDWNRFKNLYSGFRVYNNVEDSVWKTLTHLYSSESADLLLHDRLIDTKKQKSSVSC